MNGKILSEIRHSLKQSMQEFADNANISKSLVNQIENGHTKMTNGTYLKVMEYLKSINYDAEKRGIKIVSNFDTDATHITSDEMKLYSLKAAKPYYAIDAFGTPGSFIVDQNIDAIEPAFYICIPELKEVDFYIRVTGDSMYPKYRHGDIIGIKKLNARQFFAWYEPYVVITRGNFQRLLKYIHPHDGDSEKLMLVSYDREKYPPQPIMVEDIHEIYQVLGKIEI